MNLTKFEQRVLDPKFLRQSKFHFWIGVLCIVLSFSTFLIEPIMVKKARTPFAQTIEKADTLVTNTECEIALKGMVVGLIDAAESGWVANAKSKTQNLFIFFLFMGIFVTSFSVFHRRCHLLARKIATTPNQEMKADEK